MPLEVELDLSGGIPHGDMRKSGLSGAKEAHTILAEIFPHIEKT